MNTGNNTTVNFTPFSDVEELNNKRKLKILSQSPEELIVEISRVTEPNESTQSNAINATTLNSRFTEMKNSLNSALNEKTGSVVRVKNEQNIYQASDVNFDDDPQKQINDRLKISDLLDKVYPVGSIYMNVNETNPESFIGGTWVELQDRFLIGAGLTYSGGATGGEASHILTINEMPSHTHTQKEHNHTQQPHTHQYEYDNNNNSSGDYFALRSGKEGIGNTKIISTTALNNGTTALNENTGGGQAHNNMPPYLAVYMWKRIA